MESPMNNEFLFIIESVIVSLFALGALFLGKTGLHVFTCLCWLVGNLFVLKQVTLFGLNVVTSDVFAVGCDLAIVLLREYYSEKEAQKAIGLGILSAVFFLIVSQFLLWYTPNTYDFTHPHFEALFDSMPRILITGIGVAALSKSLNLYLLRFLSTVLRPDQFKLKTTIALCVSQFFDTALFSFLALYGTVESVWSIVGFSYAIKCLSIFICVPLITTLRELIVGNFDTTK